MYCLFFFQLFVFFNISNRMMMFAAHYLDKFAPGHQKHPGRHKHKKRVFDGEGIDKERSRGHYKHGILASFFFQEYGINKSQRAHKPHHHDHRIKNGPGERGE